MSLTSTLYLGPLAHSTYTCTIVPLMPNPTPQVLDLGCGDGALTVKIAEAGASVVGVDSAPDMVRATNELGIEASLCDGGDLKFDAVR